MPEIETSGALLEVARSFRPRILAERDHIEASRRLPEDLARELARDGFFRIFLPKAYGGLDLTPMEAMEGFRGVGAGGRLGRVVRMERQHSLDCCPTLP